MQLTLKEKIIAIIKDSSYENLSPNKYTIRNAISLDAIAKEILQAVKDEISEVIQ